MFEKSQNFKKKWACTALPPYFWGRKSWFFVCGITGPLETARQLSRPRRYTPWSRNHLFGRPHLQVHEIFIFSNTFFCYKDQIRSSKTGVRTPLVRATCAWFTYFKIRYLKKPMKNMMSSRFVKNSWKNWRRTKKWMSLKWMEILLGIS